MAITTQSSPLRDTAAWHALEAHAAEIRGLHLRELCGDDSKRGERLTLEAEGILVG